MPWQGDPVQHQCPVMFNTIHVSSSIRTFLCALSRHGTRSMLAETGDESNLAPLRGLPMQLSFTTTPNGHCCPSCVDEKAQ